VTINERWPSARVTSGTRALMNVRVALGCQSVPGPNYRSPGYIPIFVPPQLHARSMTFALTNQDAGLMLFDDQMSVVTT
jgi:hypothetical protein